MHSVAAASNWWGVRMAAQRRVLPRLRLGDAAETWSASLAARNLSPRTLQGYREGLDLFAPFLAERGHSLEIEQIEREDVEAFLTDLLSRHRPSTAATRHRSLRLFLKWCVLEGELERSPTEHVRPPMIPEGHAPVLSLDVVRALLKVTSGRDFVSRRDHAILMLFVDTGVRLSELTGLNVADTDLHGDRVAWVKQAKGRRPRRVALGRNTILALDRYLRSRAGHRDADLPTLWLGVVGPLRPSGVAQMLRRLCGGRTGARHRREPVEAVHCIRVCPRPPPVTLRRWRTAHARSSQVSR
jgi:integrase/recombinase XerC